MKKLLVLFAVLALPAAFAATVGPSDSIQSAVNNASVNETIGIEEGTYVEDVDVNVSGVTLTAVNDTNDTVIEGRISVQAPRVTVEELTITNPDGGPESFIGVTVANGVATDAGSNTDGLVVRDNHIHSIGTALNATALSDGAGVLLFGTNNAVVQGNTIESVRGGTEPDQFRAAKGVHLADSNSATENVSVVGNDIHDVRNFGTSNDGIGILGYTGSFEDVTIRGNNISGIEGDAGSAISIGTPGSGGGLVITGNTVQDAISYRQAGNDGEGVVLFGGIDASTVQVNQNNLLTEVGVWNLLNQTVDAEENWWGDAVGPTNTSDNTSAAAVGQVDFDPWLCEPARSNFTTTNGSCDTDNDGVGNNLDVCPASELDDIELAPNQYAQNGDFGAFEVGPNNRESEVYTMATTNGCTCSQIVNETGAGDGHLKKGCSPSLLEEFTGVSGEEDRKANAERSNGGPNGPQSGAPSGVGR